MKTPVNTDTLQTSAPALALVCVLLLAAPLATYAAAPDSAPTHAPTPVNAPTYQIATVRGHSMHPTLPAGTRVLCDYSATVNDLHIGQVVAFHRSGTLAGTITVHRIFRQIAPGVWWTKGDRAQLPDCEYVTSENLVCRVVEPAVRSLAANGSHGAHGRIAR